MHTSTSFSAAARPALLALAAAWGGLLASSCGGAAGPTRLPEEICPEATPTPTGRLAQCAIGCDAATPTTEPARAAAVLWYTVDRDLDLGQRRGRVCIDATSMLPSPDRKGTYVIRDGELAVIRPGATRAEPVEVETGQDGWRFSRLLGFRRWTSGSPILLVEMARDEPGVYQLWSVRLLGQEGIGAPVREGEMPTSPQLFFSDFATPRCAQGHERCLVAAPLRDGVRGLGLAPRRGQGVIVKPLPDPAWTLLDASWVPGRPGEVVLLVGGACGG